MDKDQTPEQQRARENLRAAGAEFQAIRPTYDASRERVGQAVVDALRAGLTPTEATRLSGYTREGVRKIARAAGIEPS